MINKNMKKIEIKVNLLKKIEEKKETTKHKLNFHIDKSMLNILRLEEIRRILKGLEGVNINPKLTKKEFIGLFQNMEGFFGISLMGKDLTVKRIGELIKISSPFKDYIKDFGLGYTSTEYFIEEKCPCTAIIPPAGMTHRELGILNGISSKMDIYDNEGNLIEGVYDMVQEEFNKYSYYSDFDKFCDVDFRNLLVTTKDGEFTTKELSKMIGQSVI